MCMIMIKTIKYDLYYNHNTYEICIQKYYLAIQKKDQPCDQLITNRESTEVTLWTNRVLTEEMMSLNPQQQIQGQTELKEEESIGGGTLLLANYTKKEAL